MQEIWVEIQGYNNYEVSNFGRIKSKEKKDKRNAFRAEKILKDHDNMKGYKFVALTNDFGRRNFYVHRVVGTHFIPMCEYKSDINHIDGDKSNNHSYNLEWCTKSENIQHAIENGLFKNKTLDVNELKRLYYEESKTFVEIGKIYNVSKSLIANKIKEYKKREVKI